MKKINFWLLLSCTSICSFGQGALNPSTNHGTGAGNSGYNNTSIGYQAGDVVTSNRNVFVGNESGKLNTSGGNNTFVGHESGRENTTGSSNCFYGSQNGKSNLTGSQNSFFGAGSGSFTDTGYGNSFFGLETGLFNNSGYNNSYFGKSSGYYSMGNLNTFLGSQSGYNNINGSSNVFIGYQSGYNETGSNKLYIENSNALTPLIYGDFSTDKVGINSLPNTTHTLTVGGTIHATGIYVNGQSLSDAGFEFWTKAGDNVWNNTGNVGIGTALTQNPHSYKLAVNGKLGAHEVQIENNSLTWPDFVFADDYKLLSLEEVEKYIKANKHLPEIPSEKEVKENGILLGEMNAKLLQKIEELTLYMIEIKKENEKLRHKYDELETKLEKN